VWYCPNANGGSGVTITATFGGTTAFTQTGYIEFSGIALTSPLDTTASGVTSGATITTGAFSTSQANEALIVFANVDTTSTFWFAGSGYTIAQGAFSNVMAIEYQIVAALQTGATADIVNSDSSTSKSIFLATFGDGASAGAPLRRNSLLTGLGSSGPFFQNPLN
jgi:hypothetical protein